MHADHRAPCGPGLQRRGAQAAGRPPCVTGLCARSKGSGRWANSRSAKKAAAESPAPPLPGGSPPPALSQGLQAYFQPAPAREGLPELVSPAPSGGPPGKPGASQRVQGPATESGRTSVTLSRHGPGLGQGGKDPAHGSAEGLHQRFHAAEAGRKGPSTSRMSAASQSPHHSDNALASLGTAVVCFRQTPKGNSTPSCDLSGALPREPRPPPPFL